MPLVPIREAAFAGLHSHLCASFPEMDPRDIARNNPDDLTRSTPMPCVRCYDGDHGPSDLATSSENAIRLQWMVQGWVEVAGPEELGPALNLLWARVIEAVVKPEAAILVELVDGHLELFLEAGQFTSTWLKTEEDERDSAFFMQEFTFELTFPRGLPFVELPEQGPLSP